MSDLAACAGLSNVPAAAFRERQSRLRAFLRGSGVEAAAVGGSSSRYGSLAWVANHVPAAGQSGVVWVAADGPTIL